MGVNSFIKWYIDGIQYPGSSVATTTAPFISNQTKENNASSTNPQDTQY